MPVKIPIAVHTRFPSDEGIFYVYLSLEVIAAEDLVSAMNFITVILLPFQIINIDAK